MKFLIFLNLFFCIISVLPHWNLDSSSHIRLDINENTYTYPASSKNMYGLNGVLKKSITRNENGEITHKNRLYINDVDYGEVSFEQIESLYKIDDQNIHRFCPSGSFDAFKINENNLEQINNNIDKKVEWDIKCFYHSTTNFIVFYFHNGENQAYVLRDSYIKYQYLQLHRELNYRTIIMILIKMEENILLVHL